MIRKLTDKQCEQTHVGNNCNNHNNNNNNNNNNNIAFANTRLCIFRKGARMTDLGSEP